MDYGMFLKEKAEGKRADLLGGRDEGVDVLHAWEVTSGLLDLLNDSGLNTVGHSETFLFIFIL